MAITVEPYTYVEGVGATRHCDMILVTDNGHERLSTSPAGRLQIAS
jgi:Xaa-Pro aminopeptidase